MEWARDILLRIANALERIADHLDGKKATAEKAADSEGKGARGAKGDAKG